MFVGFSFFMYIGILKDVGGCPWGGGTESERGTGLAAHA